jgi:hypothetical protein
MISLNERLRRMMWVCVLGVALICASSAARAQYMGPEYTTAMTDALVLELKSSPWVQPTTSANPTTLVVHTLPQYTQSGKPTIPALPIYGFNVTDPTALGPKVNIGVLGGVHAREQAASYVLESFLRTLVSDTPEMAALRQKANIYVYPQMNPQARYAYNLPGNPYNVQRGDMAHPGTGDANDLNRHWENPTSWPQTQAIQTVMKADAGSVDLFLDFHGRSYTAAELTSRTPYESYKQIWTSTDNFDSPYALAVVARDPAIQLWEATANPAAMTASRWAESSIGLNADFGYALEVARDMSLSVYEGVGTTHAYALYDTVVPEPAGFVLIGTLAAFALTRRAARVVAGRIC